MLWILKAWRRLAEQGVLGMNRRNAAYILDHNPRSAYPLVDSKLRMHELCVRMGVPTPEVHGSMALHSALRQLPEVLAGLQEFVIKPDRGSAGRGVIVVVGRDGPSFVRHSGETLRLEQIRQHVSDILSGMYSLSGLPDQAIIQQRVHLHPAFEPIAYRGIPDLRIIVYRGEPAMAMLRLPTRRSNGRANLHQGGIGVGVDLSSGITHHAVQHNRAVVSHPDTGQPLVGIRVPCWSEVLDMSRQIAAAVELGYVGVDIVVDAEHGPMLLEANARPGLAIQIANARGLLPRLSEIDELARRPQAQSQRARRSETGEKMRHAA